MPQRRSEHGGRAGRIGGFRHRAAQGLRHGVGIACAVFSMVLTVAAVPAAAMPAAMPAAGAPIAAGARSAPPGPAVGAIPASPTVDPRDASPDAWAQGIVRSGDAVGLPFAIVDKRRATLRLYAADGRLVAQTPVLLGAWRGDRSRPGVGERTQAGRLQPEDRTTPAGRFEARLGPNADRETVVWVDWEAAFAIHRLRPGRSESDRAQRLASDVVHRRRVSDGCVVVPARFFDTRLQPLIERHRGRAVVYVLPELEGPAEAAWLALGAGAL